MTTWSNDELNIVKLLNENVELFKVKMYRNTWF